MSANSTVLEVLASEGVPMTEGELLRQVQGQTSILDQGTTPPGRRTFSDLIPLEELPLRGKEILESVPVRAENPGDEPISSEVTVRQPGPHNGDPNMGPAHGITGTWRTIYALPGRGMCCLGIHPASWVYLHQGDCNQLRDCERCGTTKLRVKHRRTWQYVRPKTCRQTKVCQRCDSSENSRINHEAWSESYSTGPDTRAHRCKRCGEVQSWSTANDD